MLEWVKFVEEDRDTYPEWGGNWDDCSKDVIVCYSRQDKPGQIFYSEGYTDWDGDSHYWNIKPITDRIIFEVIAWTYFNKHDTKNI